MEQIELIQHWNYFCSLAERLDDTKHYIDHGLQEHDGIRELVHGKVLICWINMRKICWMSFIIIISSSD